PYTSAPSRNNSRKQETVVCYNYKGEGHMSKQCTKPKRKRDEAWFKDKNLNFPTQQDALILYVIEQLKTQVVNCTKINQDNKSVNKTLTVELERYKDQVRILKEGNNVDKVSNSWAQSMKIDNLKQTLAKHLKEKPTQVEVPKELTKVSIVNSSLKKLKFHLAGFDVVVKERITATAITEGT
nr:hypothetical protein [Tanacetum cinerariifolium]